MILTLCLTMFRKLHSMSIAMYHPQGIVLTHSPTHSLTSLLTHLLTHSLAYSLLLTCLPGDAKLEAVLPFVGDFLSDKLKGKLLIFGHHRNVLDGICRYLDDYGGTEYIRIDGTTPSKDRQSRVQFFQNSTSCRVAVLAITAAGVALTLTAASTIFFAEIYWTPVLTYLLTHSLAYSLTHSLTHSLAYSRTLSLPPSLLLTLTHSLTHSSF